MKIAVRDVQNVRILELRDKVTIGVGDIALRDAISECLEAGYKNILINLGGVRVMDSSGIGELVSVYTTVSNRGGKLKLSNLSSEIRALLQLTKLISVFEVYDDEQEALNSFL